VVNLREITLMKAKEVCYEIKPPRGLIDLNLPEVWRYRELLYIFAWRDVKVKYKQTILGIAWAIFQPFITMVVFSIFFGSFAKIPSENIPYPIFVYTGLLLWNYFSISLTSASECLIANEGIIKKVYFPRLLLPFATTVTPAIDFLFALLILFALMIYYHFTPTVIGVILIPVLLLISFLGAAGLGLLLSALNAKFRDVRYVLPFMIQTLLFVTPVIYPVSIIPAKFQWLMYLNPMTGVITTARASLLKTEAINFQILLYSFLVSIIFLLIGIFYFRKTERFLADVL